MPSPVNKGKSDDVEMASLVENDSNGSDNNYAHQLPQNGTDADANGDTSKQKWTLRSSGGIKALSACGLYSFCSVSMILANKSLASRYVGRLPSWHCRQLSATELKILSGISLTRSFAPSFDPLATTT